MFVDDSFGIDSVITLVRSWMVADNSHEWNCLVHYDHWRIPTERGQKGPRTC